MKLNFLVVIEEMKKIQQKKRKITYAMAQYLNVLKKMAI